MPNTTLNQEEISGFLHSIRVPGFWSVAPEQIDNFASRLKRNPDITAAAGIAVKLCVLSSFLTDYTIDMLRLMLVRRGIGPIITSPGYGQMMNEIIGKGPVLGASPDLVLLLPSYRDLRFAPSLGATIEDEGAAVANEIAFWMSVVQEVPAPVIMLSFGPPPYRVLADGDGFQVGGLTRFVRKVNMGLAEALPSSATLIDAESLHCKLGPPAHSPRLYALCKQPYDMEALPVIADALAAGIVGHLGRGRKVLVLDLDNTLWGGQAGDIGLEVELGVETPEGEAFVAFQQEIKKLCQRGITLAVCSKNTDQIARSVFETHPAMVLRPEDIACFVANFEDKATNLRTIAKTLNVGLDALVFVDDSQVERAWVSRELPEVWVIDLPDEPAQFAEALHRENPFPMYRLTREDLTRAQSYRILAETKRASDISTNMEAFLQDMEPVATIEAVDKSSIDRIDQLIGKTNQFKLNSFRASAQQLLACAGDVLAIRLSDRLQDYGIVTVVLTERVNETLMICNWVMSCRVFGRRMEHMVLETLAAAARQSGAVRICLDFEVSAKNGILPDLLKSMGFVNDMGQRFEYSLLDSSAPLPHFMKVIDKRTLLLADQFVPA